MFFISKLPLFEHRAICIRCAEWKGYKGGSTSGLAKHLRYCNRVTPLDSPEESSPAATPQTSQPLAPTDSTGAATVAPFTRHHDTSYGKGQRMKGHVAVLKYILQEVKGLDCLDRPALLNLAGALNPSYQSCTRRVARRLMHHMAKAVRGE